MWRQAFAAAVLLIAEVAVAEGTLEGRIVTFTVLAYDDPENPFFLARGKTVKVGQGVEFGLDREGWQNGVDVAPVDVNIGPTRIEVQFREGPGQLLTARFNGYVLRFETDCALFESVRIDPAGTNMPLEAAAITSEVSTLYINMTGMDYSPESRIAVEVKVADCPLS
jgi:hypothetical protein